ncbi:MAG: tetratricopeptide repeat protein [Isosphaeraceae bacterium]
MSRMAQTWRILCIVTLISATASSSWGQAGGASSRTRPRPGQKAARENAGKAKGALSDSDYLGFAKAIETAVSTGNQQAFGALMDWEATFKAMARGWEMPEKTRQEIFQGLRQGVSQGGGITGQLINNSKQGGLFTYLRTRENHGRKVVLFRMIKPMTQGGINYFEFVPERSPDGKVRSSDIYIYASGEFISATLRNILLPVISGQSQSFLEKLVTGEKALVKDFPEWTRAATLSQQGKAAEALAIIKKLSPETQKQKMVLLARLQAAQKAGDAEYMAVLEDFRKYYPNDPCLDLISIDSYIMKQSFDGALKAVDRLDKSLGGDPYLNVTRAGISEADGKLEAAKKYSRQAIDEEPTLAAGYLSLVGISLKEKKYEDTLAGLKEIDQKLHLQFNDLSQVPEYAGFVASPQYPKWLAYLKQKDQPKKTSPARQPKRPTRTTKNRPGVQKPGS